MNQIFRCLSLLHIPGYTSTNMCSCNKVPHLLLMYVLWENNFLSFDQVLAQLNSKCFINLLYAKHQKDKEWIKKKSLTILKKLT